MARDKRTRIIIIIAAILVVLIASVITVSLMRSSQSDKQDPYKYGSTTNSADEGTEQEAEDASPSTPSKPAENSTNDKPATTLDPATVATIDIAPMNISVPYVKGVGGFEYQVLRTPNGTQYVEFRSGELVGTKCTADTGAFASVLADPQSGESATLEKTTTIGETKYGLSLASSSCTADTAKLKEYQKSFSDAFSLLKKLD